ncbi:hypothetical protein BJ741DRAFT_628549 [Chytriomyces cf. hyalinus JEL632]|nr:hypothetical protein BJ741DRAFT_628549 [Chytriomyces cf. hyalinus JEL632]
MEIIIARHSTDPHSKNYTLNTHRGRAPFLLFSRTPHSPTHPTTPTPSSNMDQLLAACATATSPDAIPSSTIPGHPNLATCPASLSRSPTDSGVGRSKDLLPALSASPSMQPAAVHEQTKPQQQQQQTQQQQQHGSTSPVSSVDPRRQRRYRIPKDEMEGLKEFFERNSRPSSEQIHTLSAKLGMEERKVRIWFQNMRSRKGNKSNSPSKPSTSNTQTPTLQSLPEQKTYPPVQSGKPPTPAYHPAFQTDTTFKPPTERISSKHMLPPPQLHSLAPTPSVVEARQFTLPPLSVTSAVIDESFQKNRFPLPPVPFYHPSNSANHQSTSVNSNAAFDGRYPQMDSRDHLPFPSVAYPHAIPSSISSLSGGRQPPIQVSNPPYPTFHTHPSHQQQQQLQQQGSDMHYMVPQNAPSQQLGQPYFHTQQQQQQLVGNTYAYHPLLPQQQQQQQLKQLHLNQIPAGPMHPVDPYRPVTGLPIPTPSGTVSPVTPATNSPASFTVSTLEAGKHGYPHPPSKMARRRTDSHDDDEDVEEEDADSHRSSSTANRKGEKRFIMSREHLRWLKQIFEETPFPSSDQMQYIADTVGMDKRQVRVWFQNRRAVLKRKMHPGQ